MDDYQYKCIQILLRYQKQNISWEEVKNQVEELGDSYNIPAAKRYSTPETPPLIDEDGTVWFNKDMQNQHNTTGEEPNLDIKNTSNFLPPSNILKIDSLDDGWRDKDDILLHACFQLLSDFVEKEMLVQNYPDWNYDDEIKKARKEIEELYEWWQQRKKGELKEELTSFEDDHFNYLQDNEMLKRLIDVRMYLWT